MSKRSVMIADSEGGAGKVVKKKYGMVIDLEKCTGCKGCSVSCKNEHEIPPGVNFCWVYQEGPVGTYPNVHMYYLPRACMRCSEPICVKVCPTKASYLTEEGIVLIDEDRCFGCQYCIWACPYEARFLHPGKKIVQKCNSCIHLVAMGKDPNCVVNCQGKARYFGDLNDPESQVSRVLAQNTGRVFRVKEELKVDPQVYYLLAKKVKIK